MGCSLLVGPLTKSGSVQNIFRSSQIRLWNTGPSGSGRLDSLPEGPFEAANIIPPAFSSWGDPQRSRSPPRLQTALIGTSAKNSFPHWHSSICFAWFPYDSGAFSSAPKQKTSFLPSFYVKHSVWLLPLSRNIAFPVFHFLSPLSPDNSYPLFKFQLWCDFQVREVFLDPRRRFRALAFAPTGGYAYLVIESTYHTLLQL